MKTAVITGANRGIGKEIARQLAQKSFQIILTARDLVKAEQAANEIGGDIIPMQLDVADDQSAKAFGTALAEKVDYVDVLINNAGIIGSKPLLDFDLEEIRAVMETNFFGVLRATKEVMPLLRKSKEGRIINISSGMGELASLIGGYAGYRLSKVGLNGFTILLANELRSTPIRVNAVCPGWVRTDMGGAGASLSVEEGADTAVWLSTEPSIPTGKFLRNRREIPW